MPDDDAASSSGSTSGISEGTAAYTIQSSNDPEQGLMNDDSVVIDIPFEKQVKPNGVVRRSTSECKPVFSSIEQFNPSEASNWVKQQIIDKVQEHPKFKSAINYTRIDFFRPYVSMTTKYSCRSSAKKRSTFCNKRGQNFKCSESTAK